MGRLEKKRDWCGAVNIWEDWGRVKALVSKGRGSKDMGRLRKRRDRRASGGSKDMGRLGKRRDW